MATDYRLNGRSVTREEFLKNSRGITAGAPQRYGDVFRVIESEAMACHSSQVAEQNEYVKKNGIRGVEFRPDGTAVCHSRKALEKLTAHYGCHVGRK